MICRRKFMGLSTLFASALLSSRLGHMAFGASAEIWGTIHCATQQEPRV